MPNLLAVWGLAVVLVVQGVALAVGYSPVDEYKNVNASTLTLEKPAVSALYGTFQVNYGVDPVVYSVMEGNNIALGCMYPNNDVPDGLVVDWHTSTQMPSTHSSKPGFNYTEYQIKNSTSGDSGIYTCRARSHSNLSEPSHLNLTVVPEKHAASTPLPKLLKVRVTDGTWQMDDSVDPAVYYVIEGSKVSMSCSFRDLSDVPDGLVLHWHTSSTKKPSTHVPKPVRGSVLDLNYQIKNFTLGDSGIYTCGSRFHRKIIVPYHLNLTAVPANATYLTTSILHPNVTHPPAQWEISFMAHPNPVFKWKSQGKVLLDSTEANCEISLWVLRRYKKCRVLKIADSGRGHLSIYEMVFTTYKAKLVLTLNDPRPADNGMYTLEASLPGTDIKTTTNIFLMMPGKPQNVELKSNNDQVILKEGSSFSFTCMAEGYPKPNLTLLFNDDPAETSGKNQVEETEGTDEEDETSMAVQTLHWKGAAEEPGQFRCKAENYLGTVYSTPQQILVTDGDSLRAISMKLEIIGKKELVADEVVVAVKGDDLLFTCRANRGLVTKPLTWILNGEPLDSNRMEQWGLEVKEKDTRLSRVSTIRTPSLDLLSKFENISILCMGEGGGNASLDLHLQEMVKPEWNEMPPEEYQGNLNETLTLKCSANGTSPLKVVWRKAGCRLVKSNKVKMDDSHLYIKNLLPEDNGEYSCEISNRAGSLSASFTVDIRDTNGQLGLDQDDQKTKEKTVTGILIAAVVVLGLFSCRRVYQSRKNRLGVELVDQKRFLEGEPTRLNPDLPLEQQADLLPYNIKFEVPRDSIFLGKLLGAGNFARVYKGEALNLLPGQERTTVAVKMISTRMDYMQVRAMRAEIKIMIHIGQHINIVNLLGACSNDLASRGELLLLLEYCRHGNILDYMHRYRDEFISQITDEDQFDLELSEPQPTHPSDSRSIQTDQPPDGDAAPSSTLAPHCSTTGDAGSLSTTSVATGETLQKGTIPGTSGGRMDPKSVNVLFDAFSSRDVLGWAYQIAKGMEYLTSKKVLHTDLAARNVLLAPNNIIKISDFGLSKQIYHKNIYKNKRRGLMPVKWLAVECLRDGIYSTQSDVWSFGVVLWEIFSLGQMPYACTVVDEDFVRKLENGLRLDHPPYATKSLYNIMLNCWSTEPVERPSFSWLAASFADILGDKQVQKYKQQTAPYHNDNTLNEFFEKLPNPDYTAKIGQGSVQG